MIGLGAGARSYTSSFHYSTPYAVGRENVQRVIDDYVDQSEEEHRVARHGIELSTQEQKRRFVIQGLMQASGLSCAEYTRVFERSPLAEFSQLTALLQHDLATEVDGHLVLNPAGLERSDAIGPWLCSDEVGRRMEEYEWT